MSRAKTLKPFVNFLSYILERNPYEFGLVPDKNGFIKIKELIKAIVEEDGWRHIKKSNLDELLYVIPDTPIEIKDNLIRSTKNIQYQKPVFAEKMPKEIFTAIRQKAHYHVVNKGITSGSHEFVIMTEKKEMAEKIGSRIDRKPIILTINTSMAEESGVFFFSTGESIFLAKYIPTGCFTAPPLPVQKKKTVSNVSKTSKNKTQTTSGTYFPDIENTTKKTSKKSDKRDKNSWKENKKKLRREKSKFEI